MLPISKLVEALRERLLNAVSWVLLGGSILIIAYGVYFNIRMMVAPGAQEYREGAMLATTALLLRGENPYAEGNMPVYTNVYGVLYNGVVAPFAGLWGTTFFIHRMITGIFLLLSSCLIFALVRRSGGGAILGLAGAAVFYHQLVSSYSVVARPDGTGLFLMLLALYLPWREEFSTKSLVLSAVLSVLGFLTKPYFISGLPCIACFLFLARSKRRGITFFIGGFAFWISVLFMIGLRYPYYLHCIFDINPKVGTSSFAHLTAQLRPYFLQNAGFLGVLMMAAVLQLGNRARIQAGAAVFRKIFSWNRWRNMDAPLLPFNPGLPAVVFVASLTITLAWMGWKTGAYTIYFVHLVSPFLIVSALRIVIGQPARNLIYRSFLLLNVLILSFQLPDLPSDLEEEHAFWRNLVLAHESAFVPPVLTHLLVESGQPIYDSGQTEYFRSGFSLREIQQDVSGISLYEGYFRELHEKVLNREFDLIVAVWSLKHPILQMDLVRENYMLLGVHPVFTYFSEIGREQGSGYLLLEVWVPKEE